MQTLFCANCKKDTGLLRDARIRTGMVVYCKECDEKIQRLLSPGKQTSEPPDFLKGLFR